MTEATITAPAPTDIWFAGTLMRVLADHDATAGQLSLIEQRADRGFSPPAHVHRNEDHLLYLIEGEVTVRLGDDERVIRPGEIAWLPRGTVHTFRIDSDQARLLEITTPAGFERFHVELGEPAVELRVPDPAPLDVAALAAGSARFGCEIVGPPMTPGAGQR
jgi:quercetin dioxygenase-like cupin family protein